ncbi:MAG: hypothetical protein ABMA25_25645 [Ilumatobacteraceae bacterium]
MRRLAALATVVLLLAACGGSNKGNKGANNGNNGNSNGTATGLDTTVASAPVDAGPALPAECTPAPYTVTALREGSKPAGAAEYGVVGTAALPIPLVPDAAQALTPAQVSEQGTSTELLGYVVFFGDEAFGPADVSMFGGYAPTADGNSRGAISIFPSSTTPLAVGDVLTPGALDGLDMLTTLNRISVDFKATPDELTAYLNTIEGTVTILGLNSSSICVEADLRWGISGGGPDADGALTVKGIFTAPLADRTLAFT